MWEGLRSTGTSSFCRCKNYTILTTQYVYIENGSKNRQGGINDIRVENKNVPVIANPDAGNRCHVYLLDLYLSKVPPAA